MKIRCLREQHALDGVSIFTLSTAEVPVAEVIEHRLLDVPEHELNGATEEGAASAPDGASGNPASPQRFRYRVGDPAAGGDGVNGGDGLKGGDGVVEAEGMILATGSGSMLAFLEHRYVPDEASDRTVDRLCRQLHAGEITRSDWLLALERQVLRQENQPARRYRRFERDLAPPPSFIALRDEVIEAMMGSDDSRGRFYVRSGTDEGPHAVVAPFTEEVEEEKVPRWRFVTAGGFGQGIGSWDGRRYRVVDRYQRLPQTLQSALERDGQAVSMAADWFLPLPDLEVVFLLRVPFQREVADLREAGPTSRLPELARPCFLVDSRRPVALRGQPDLEVVEDPEHAIAVLTRCTARGAYVPNMPASPVGDIALSTEGQPARYVAGCWVR